MTKSKLQVRCSLIQQTELTDAVVLTSSKGKVEMQFNVGEASDNFQLGKLYNVFFEETSVISEPPKPLIKLT